MDCILISRYIVIFDICMDSSDDFLGHLNAGLRGRKLGYLLAVVLALLWWSYHTL